MLGPYILLIALAVIGAVCYGLSVLLLPRPPEPVEKTYKDERRLIEEGKGDEILPQLETELLPLRESSPFRPILNALIGTIHMRGRRFTQAQEYLEKAVRGARQMDQNIGSPGAPRSVLAHYLNDLGVTLSLQGKAVKAEEVLREALAIRRERAAEKGMIHDYRVGATLSNLGHALARQNRFEEAETAMVEGLAQFAPFAIEDPAKYGKRFEVMRKHVEKIRARNPENSLY